MSYPAFLASSNQQQLKQKMFGENFKKKSGKHSPKNVGMYESGSGSLLHTDSTKVLLASFFPQLPNCPTKMCLVTTH
jgi:hypothetical protein